MNVSELAALIHNASLGDDDAFSRLYAVVCRPLYKIARIALKTEEQAINAIKLTVNESYEALPCAEINDNGAFVEWIVKILCSRIKQIYKNEGDAEDTVASDGECADLRQALNSLPDIERLVLAVTKVCSCGAETAARLCGYTEETVAVCLTNAEMTLKSAFSTYSEI